MIGLDNFLRAGKESPLSKRNEPQFCLTDSDGNVMDSLGFVSSKTSLDSPGNESFWVHLDFDAVGGGECGCLRDLIRSSRIQIEEYPFGFRT